jgi:glutamate formiminotransferase
MTLVAVPNVSEGANEKRVAQLAESVAEAGARVLNVHSDPVHDRTVLTTTGSRSELVDGMSTLASACLSIDLTRHHGVHPRLGALDVCPIVPHDEPIAAAVETARAVGKEIAHNAGLPVFLYGAAAERVETRELPDLRRGGLEALAERIDRGLIPDFGPGAIDRRRGVVCVGARDVLIAFNVWIEADPATARAIARAVRSPAVRALGLPMREGTAQISMNLIAPQRIGVDRVFATVEGECRRHEIRVTATEIVGLVPERFMPDPSKEAARLLMQPGRSLESALDA